jgi:hypothetical protein
MCNLRSVTVCYAACSHIYKLYVYLYTLTYYTIIYEVTYTTFLILTFTDSGQVTITVVVLWQPKTLDTPGDDIYLVSHSCFQVMVLRYEVIYQNVGVHVLESSVSNMKQVYKYMIHSVELDSIRIYLHFTETRGNSLIISEASFFYLTYFMSGKFVLSVRKPLH